MSLTLEQNRDKNKYQQDFQEEPLSSGYWQWGKAHTVSENIIMAMQSPATCKDYVVDTYYKDSSGSYSFNCWTKEEREENCIYISFPNKDVQKTFLNNLSKFLNPWFAENAVEPTIARTITASIFASKPSRLYGITGDAKWTQNAFTWSIYLSILRLCGYKEDMESLDFGYDDPHNRCNEHYYYDQSRLKQLILEVFQNPFQYFGEVPTPFHNTGYKTTPSHGQTGPFYICSCITNETYDMSSILKGGYFGNLLYQKHTGKKYKHVR